MLGAAEAWWGSSSNSLSDVTGPSDCSRKRDGGQRKIIRKIHAGVVFVFTDPTLPINCFPFIFLIASNIARPHHPAARQWQRHLASIKLQYMYTNSALIPRGNTRQCRCRITAGGDPLSTPSTHVLLRFGIASAAPPLGLLVHHLPQFCLPC